MKIIITWLSFVFLLCVIKPWLTRRFSKSTERLQITSIKEYLYDKIDFANRFDIGSTISRGDYIVVYKKLQNNGFIDETIVISNHPLKGKSYEVIIEYLNDKIVAVKIDNRKMNSCLTTDNERSAHKILELGQRAFKGKTVP